MSRRARRRISLSVTFFVESANWNLSLAESADWKTPLNNKQCDWPRCARRTEYLTAFRRLELDTGLRKLKFGCFHGLSEIEGRIFAAYRQPRSAFRILEAARSLNTDPSSI
jgi:hypothetical protein